MMGVCSLQFCSECRPIDEARASGHALPINCFGTFGSFRWKLQTISNYFLERFRFNVPLSEAPQTLECARLS